MKNSYTELRHYDSISIDFTQMRINVRANLGQDVDLIKLGENIANNLDLISLIIDRFAGDLGYQ